MRLDVDFGGSKIEAALLDSKGGILARQRAPNPGNNSESLAVAAALAASVEATAGVRGATWLWAEGEM